MRKDSAIARAGYNQYSLNFYHCTQLLQLSFFASTIIAIIVITYCILPSPGYREWQRAKRKCKS